MFVIWPGYATREISLKSKMATFFARLIERANILALPGALVL